MRRKREISDWIVATRSTTDGDRESTEQSSQVIRITPGRQRRVQSGDVVVRSLVLIDCYEHDVTEELSFIDVDVVVDPTLAHRAVRNCGVVASQRRKLVDELIRRGARAEVDHHRPVVRIRAATRIVVQVLLGAVIDARNATAR